MGEDLYPGEEYASWKAPETVRPDAAAEARAKYRERLSNGEDIGITNPSEMNADNQEMSQNVRIGWDGTIYRDGRNDESGQDLSSENQAFLDNLRKEKADREKDPKYQKRQADHQLRHEAEDAEIQGKIQRGEIAKGPSLSSLRDAINNS